MATSCFPARITAKLIAGAVRIGFNFKKSIPDNAVVVIINFLAKGELLDLISAVMTETISIRY